MAYLSPYLNFDSNCREAMNFYKDCLGGELTIQTVGEMPEMAKQMPPHIKDHILHSSLTSGDINILASDLHRGPRVEGNTIHLCINCKSDEELERFFSNLSNGGEIVEPLANMPWGGRYGALTDKFGKQWIFNYQKN